MKIKLTLHEYKSATCLGKKKPKQFYGFKKREGLFLEDNLRKYLEIVSDNIAEKLV